MTTYNSYDIRQLVDELVGSKIRIRGRLHTTRKTGQLCFMVLRYQNISIQAVAHKKGVNDFNDLVKMPTESVIILKGLLKSSPFDINFTSYKKIELEVEGWELVTRSEPLSFSIDDANDFGNGIRSDVGNQVRYDHRWLDLRTPVNNAIFKLQSGISTLFREYLVTNNFVEIHSPKTIGVKSEGGANVFALKYFDRDAYLAQSPQLYKQMAINADMDRVFEVGPIFRAEYSFSNRHLCEFTGLDLEMTISESNNYNELIHMIWGTMIHIFDGLQTNYKQEIETVRYKLPFTDLVYQKEPLIINWLTGITLLKEAGFEQNPMDDLSTENERELGNIIKTKYNSDIFVLFGYPTTVRPFYTMRSEEDPSFTYSWDIIMRGQEISSGAQREHRYDVLLTQVVECGVDPTSLHDYIASFSNGSFPHGGTGFGLERILTFFLELGNIRQASLCPRDPKRLNP
jgi:aspartyl-tRNA synthetase